MKKNRRTHLYVDTSTGDMLINVNWLAKQPNSKIIKIKKNGTAEFNTESARQGKLF